MTPPFEARQHLQEQVIDVSTDFHGVRAVDKKNVVGVELCKEFEVEFFYSFLN